MNDIKILFEDKDIVVCVKPVGIPSQEDSAGGESMVSLLSDGRPYVAVVHRLDTGVGGVMVYAKTKSAAAKLSAGVSQSGNFQKKYLAAVTKRPENDSGEYRDLLFKDSFLKKSFVVDRMRKGVKEAILFYDLIEYNEKKDLSLVKVSLVTGRTHQIRVQFSSRGTPLSGDKKYGAKDGEHNIGLWAYYLSFLHPVTNERIVFSHFPEKQDTVWQNFSVQFSDL